MKKRIFIMFLLMFLLLALVVGLYALNVKADGGAVTVTQTAQPSQTATGATCEVYTGIERGTVNLRSCGSTSCAVVDIVTEGESLSIVSAGNWANVATVGNVRGWLNSNYCKGK